MKKETERSDVKTKKKIFCYSSHVNVQDTGMYYITKYYCQFLYMNIVIIMTIVNNYCLLLLLSDH